MTNNVIINYEGHKITLTRAQVRRIENGLPTLGLSVCMLQRCLRSFKKKAEVRNHSFKARKRLQELKEEREIDEEIAKDKPSVIRQCRGCGTNMTDGSRHRICKTCQPELEEDNGDWNYFAEKKDTFPKAGDIYKEKLTLKERKERFMRAVEGYD